MGSPSTGTSTDPFSDEGRNKKYTIVLSIANKQEFDYSDLEDADEALTGTKVELVKVNKGSIKLFSFKYFSYFGKPFFSFSHVVISHNIFSFKKIFT